jgi:hypothetical protein
LVPQRCICGVLEVEGHHTSYSEELQLLVLWRCQRCHRSLHAALAGKLLKL